MVVAALGTVAAGLLAGSVRAGQAPVAVGRATAVEVRPLDTSVGVSSASAGKDGASSRAVAVRAVGKDIASSSAKGNSSQSSAVLDVPVGSGSVKVMPRSASAQSSEDVSRSTAQSDLVSAHVPGLVAMEVLSGDAEAVWTPNQSASRSTADVAKLTLGDGDLVVVLMHAEGSSDGTGRLYLIRINDTVLFDSQDDRSMRLEVPDIFTIGFTGTYARGGRFTGEVVKVAWLDNTQLSQFAAAVDAAGGSSDGTVRPAADPDRFEPAARATGSARLPITGAPIAFVVFVSLALIVAGAAMSAVPRIWQSA